jgi:hypothetical protein
MAGALKCDLLEAIKKRFSTQGIKILPVQKVIVAKS